jgi:hypothetical protein
MLVLFFDLCLVWVWAVFSTFRTLMLHPSLGRKRVEWVSVHVYIEFVKTDPLGEAWDWPIQGPCLISCPSTLSLLARTGRLSFWLCCTKTSYYRKWLSPYTFRPWRWSLCPRNSGNTAQIHTLQTPKRRPNISEITVILVLPRKCLKTTIKVLLPQSAHRSKLLCRNSGRVFA